MKVFDKPGGINTDDACRIAVERAKLLNTSIVSSTTGGDSGVRLCEIAKDMGFEGKIVIVTHAFGSKEPGKSSLKDAHREAMLGYGAQLVTAAHVLSGVERGMSSKFSGVYPAEIMANTLRMLSQGIKVTVEIGCMALDAGVIDYGADIVCMGGTGRGLDTAVVMTPSHASRIFETNVHEILCMPY